MKLIPSVDKLQAGVHFMDITEYEDLHSHAQKRQTTAAVTFPAAVTQKTSITPLLSKLSTSNMQTRLTTFSNFQNRYYKSTYGKQSSEWLLAQVQAVISASGATGATARAFTHASWTQNSVIATIPGKSTNTIVIGAHQDSVNGASPSTGRAPGADDDGSGTVTILEAMRVLLTDSRVASGQAPNTIEFHWYAAEEGGLLGSQAVFTDYKNKGKVVKAMLQQDMTGYVKPGIKESVGVITDYVDVGLSNFIKKVITAVRFSYLISSLSNSTNFTDNNSIAQSHTLKPSADTRVPITPVHPRPDTHPLSLLNLRWKTPVDTFTLHKIH
ncbi:Leucine aminopeptidase 1 [Neodidymelliopsis sp. IMI 364377]|nr:Leucine aminopeptidase 1 [Neodidymelliopsis sp. IMI 364377]